MVLVLAGVAALMSASAATAIFLASGDDSKPPEPTAPAEMASADPPTSATTSPSQDPGTPEETATPRVEETPTDPTSSPTQSPTEVETPEPPAPGEVVYQSDWSSGSDGWGLGGDWRILNGELLCDGTQRGYGELSAVGPPLPSGLTDYAVEVELAILGEGPVSSYNDPQFTMAARYLGDGQGYFAGVYYDGYEDGFFTYVTTTEVDLGTVPFSPAGRNLYRLEVEGNSVRLLIDGELIISATDNIFPGGGRFGLFSDAWQLIVTSVRVIAL
ncbi:MAG: hypothetical protein WEB00_06765 [Dehalococcoidia bacterium]